MLILENKVEHEISPFKNIYGIYLFNEPFKNNAVMISGNNTTKQIFSIFLIQIKQINFHTI